MNKQMINLQNQRDSCNNNFKDQKQNFVTKK